MRSSLSSLRRQRVVGYTAGNLAAVSECFFFLPTRVGSGGSHFLGGSFFCGQAHRSHAHTHLVVLVWAAPRCTTRDLSLSVSADRRQRTMMCKRGLGQVAEAARRPKGGCFPRGPIAVAWRHKGKLHLEPELVSGGCKWYGAPLGDASWVLCSAFSYIKVVGRICGGALPADSRNISDRVQAHVRRSRA